MIVCPLHKTKLIPLDQFIVKCTEHIRIKAKFKPCPHIQYVPSDSKQFI